MIFALQRSSSANPAGVDVLLKAETAAFESHPALSAQNKALRKPKGPGQIMRSDSSFASERIVSEITFPQRADGAASPADISSGSRKTEAMGRNLSGVSAELVVKCASRND